MSLSRIVREPLLHFLLLGLLLFVYYDFVAPADTGGERIVVDQAQVDMIARQFQQTWSRPPTADELRGLVESYVRDEVLYRQGKSLGLDESDPVIKRRVRQKLDVMFEESLAHDPPGDAELAEYLARNPDRFRRPARLSFEQVLLGVPESEQAARASADRARAQLARGVEPAQVGVPTMLPGRVDDSPLDLVAREFGAEFAERLEQVPVGVWAGPVASGFGMHLVRVSAVTPAEQPALAEVRAEVAREWESERRKRNIDEAYRKLRDQYDVEITASLEAVPQVTAP
jgi:hypothetical protein